MASVSMNDIRLLLDKPEVTAEEATVFTGVGHQAVLVCNVHSSPEAELVWYRGSLMLENDNRMYREDVGTRRSLVIHHVMEEEFTAYRCQATNDLGTGSATITISGELTSDKTQVKTASECLVSGTLSSNSFIFCLTIRVLGD